MSAGPAASPRVSAIVVSYNTRDDLLRCLASLANVTLPIEIIVIDNASTDGSGAVVRGAFPAARLLASEENRGFAAANNWGLREARAPYVLILNSDAEVRPGAVEAMAAILDARPDVGIVGPRTLNPDGTVQVSFGPPLTPLSEWRQRRLVRGVRTRQAWALREIERRSAVEREPVWVSASCWLARRRCLEAIGLFDEGFFLYEEDVDLCVRAGQAGWRILFTPAAEVVHRLGCSMEVAPARARFEYHRSHLLFYRKHNGPLATVLLRVYLAIGAALGWLASIGPGQAPGQRRSFHRDVFGLALFGD